VSAPESRLAPSGAPGVRLAACPMDIIEIAAFRERKAELESLAAARGLELPAPGRIAAGPACLALSVRPGRWLLLAPPAAPGASALLWQEAATGRAAAADLSAGLTGLCVAGAAAREMLARACRLDLAGGAFPEGRAAATILVQVPAILAALPRGLLLLTPASTAQHLHEWLETASRPFGLAVTADVTVTEVVRR
jgi:heterotetrameric sarcosine oxidase gamma subunit